MENEDDNNSGGTTVSSRQFNNQVNGQPITKKMKFVLNMNQTDKTEGNDASESIVILASPNLEDKDDTDHFGTSQDEDIFDLQEKDKQQELEKGEVIYVLEENSIDGDEEHDIEDLEDSFDKDSDEPMVYMIDGEKVVLIGKHCLGGEEDGGSEGEGDSGDLDQDVNQFLDQDSENGERAPTQIKQPSVPRRKSCMKKGIKRKRGVVLKNCEERTAPVLKNGQQVVRKRDVQLFSRDELVQLPYCPEYHAEEVVLADTQDKSGVGGKRRRKMKGKGRPRPGLVSIRPKVDDPLSLNFQHFLEPILFGSDNSSLVSYSPPSSTVLNRLSVAAGVSNSSNSSSVQTTRPIILTASPTKCTESKQLPKLAIKPRVVAPLTASFSTGNIKVLKNVDVVVKTEPCLREAATKPLPPGRPLLAPELKFTTATGCSPAVKATSNGLKVAIPKNAASTSLKRKPTLSTSILMNGPPSSSPTKQTSQPIDTKSAQIQKKLDSMLKIAPSIVTTDYSTGVSQIIREQRKMEDNLIALRMETDANWEVISKDLERCNYPRLKSYIMEKHRWLWQFMKELFDRGDRCIEWRNSLHGIFAVNDIERLGQLWENYKTMTGQTGKAQCWRQLRYYFGMQDETRIIRQIPLGNGQLLFQFQALFYKERFKQYVYRPIQDFQALEKDIPNISSIIRPMIPEVPVLFCSRGCGSQFRKLEALQRHENVCTHIQD